MLTDIYKIKCYKIWRHYWDCPLFGARVGSICKKWQQNCCFWKKLRIHSSKSYSYNQSENLKIVVLFLMLVKLYFIMLLWSYDFVWFQPDFNLQFSLFLMSIQVIVLSFKVLAKLSFEICYPEHLPALIS